MTTTTTTARCLGRCEWTEGPGTAEAVDRAANKHTRAGHPTITCTEPKGR